MENWNHEENDWGPPTQSKQLSNFNHITNTVHPILIIGTLFVLMLLLYLNQIYQVPAIVPDKWGSFVAAKTTIIKLS